MRRWILVLVVLVVVVGGAFAVLRTSGLLEPSATSQAAPTPLPPIESAPEVIVDAVVVPVRFAALGMASSGIVAEIFVREGDLVEAGQPLLRLENDRQLIAIAQAEARVRSTQARIEELRAGSRPEELAVVQAAVDIARANYANVLAGTRPEDIAAAEATLAAAQAAYDQLLRGADDQQIIQAEADLANAEAAVRQAQSAYDQVRWRPDVAALPQSVELERASNNLEAARARYAQVVRGARESELAAARAEVQRARANLDRALAPATANELAAAEAQLRQAEAELALRLAGARSETLKAAEADLVEAQTILMQRQLELADTQLRAPFAGVIAALSVEVGEQVGAGTPVVRLADQSEWRIETDDLTEINVVAVREGDRVRITIDALPDLELEGIVERIRPLGESKQGDITYTATIVPSRSDPRLRWNMTASVTIRTQP